MTILPREYTCMQTNTKIPLNQAVYYCYVHLAYFCAEHSELHNNKLCKIIKIRN